MRRKRDAGLIVVAWKTSPRIVDDTVRTAAGGVESGEFWLQPFSDTMGVVTERREHELDDRGGSAPWESAQLSLGRTGDSQFVGVGVVAHVVGNRDLSSSPVT